MTKYGVEHNLAVTPYTAHIYYGPRRDYIYRFSTKAGLEKFQAELDLNRSNIKLSLENRFKMKFFLSDDFCDVQLYKRIERRGFLININGWDVKWPGSLHYNGQSLESIPLSEK